MAYLFEYSIDNISLHLKNIFQEKELDKSSTVEFFSVVRKDGNRNVTRNLEFVLQKYWKIIWIKGLLLIQKKWKIELGIESKTNIQRKR